MSSLVVALDLFVVVVHSVTSWRSRTVDRATWCNTLFAALFFPS